MKRPWLDPLRAAPSGKPAVIVVLAQRFSQGFEGHDRRFIAVTGQPR